MSSSICCTNVHSFILPKSTSVPPQKLGFYFISYYFCLLHLFYIHCGHTKGTLKVKHTQRKKKQCHCFTVTRANSRVHKRTVPRTQYLMFQRNIYLGKAQVLQFPDTSPLCSPSHLGVRNLLTTLKTFAPN